MGRGFHANLIRVEGSLFSLKKVIGDIYHVTGSEQKCHFLKLFPFVKTEHTTFNEFIWNNISQTTKKEQM